MIWLYGIDQFDGTLPCATALQIAGLTLATTEMEAAPPLTAASLREFHRFVSMLNRDANAFLPARFGQQFTDRANLEQAFGELGEELLQALELVREAEQMTLRWFGTLGTRIPAADPQGPGPGARYLAERRRAIVDAETLPEAADARRRLAPWVRAERLRKGASEGLIGSLYQLVPRRDLGAYAAELRALLADAPSRMRVSGPSANYAFAPRIEP